MKDDELRNQLLLARSGELPAEQDAALRRALRADGELQAYARDLDRVTDAAREGLAADGPSARVLARIHQEARGRRRPIAFPVRRTAWVAFAALLAALAGAALLLRWRVEAPAPAPAVAQQATQAQTLTALIVMMSEEGTASVTEAGLAESGVALPDEHHVRILASQLLRMEGLEADAAEGDAEEVPDLSAVPGDAPGRQPARRLIA